MHVSPFSLSRLPVVGQELPGHIPMSVWEASCDRDLHPSPPTQYMEPQSPAAHPSSSSSLKYLGLTVIVPVFPRGLSAVLFVPPFQNLTQVSGHSHSAS